VTRRKSVETAGGGNAAVAPAASSLGAFSLGACSLGGRKAPVAAADWYLSGGKADVKHAHISGSVEVAGSGVAGSGHKKPDRARVAAAPPSGAQIEWRRMQLSIGWGTVDYAAASASGIRLPPEPSPLDPCARREWVHKLHLWRNGLHAITSVLPRIAHVSHPPLSHPKPDTASRFLPAAVSEIRAAVPLAAADAGAVQLTAADAGTVQPTAADSGTVQPTAADAGAAEVAAADHTLVGPAVAAADDTLVGPAVAAGAGATAAVFALGVNTDVENRVRRNDFAFTLFAFSHA
jgi:hypothetical protein